MKVPSIKKPRRRMRRSPAYSRQGRLAHLIDIYKQLPLWKKIFVIAWPTFLILIFIAVITTITFAGALGSKEALMNRNNTGVTLQDRNGKTFYEFDNAHSETYVSLDDIAPVARQALISSEDKDFYKHPGFSIAGIANALYQNVISVGGGGGGSTITQQLVKNALLSTERSIFRKYQEFVLSIEVERRYSKDTILEMYLNSVYFGEGAFGIEDAAQTYFDKSAKDLDAAQAAMLVGVLPAPSAYSPISGNSEYAKERQQYVLNRMLEDGVITTDEEKSALNEELSYQDPKEDSTSAPHFALMVKQWLEDKYGEETVARSGYVVRTTLNLDQQSLAEAAVQKQVAALSSSSVTNGSAIVIDPTSGEILAMVGSVDYANTDFGKVNMTTTGRQPGSSFKPIVYATGIENRLMTAGTIFSDTAQNFSGYQPKNYDLRYHGDVTLRRALANSLNIPAVEAMQKIGVQTVLDKAKQAGITTLDQSADDYGLPLALGSGQATLLEMTSAYTSFANDGKRSDVRSVISITDKNKKEIYTSKPSSSAVFSAGTAYIISSILSDNSARAETFGSSLTVSPNRPVAVKTGTTEDYRDAWTIGYTPSLAVGVWIGNNDNSPMSAVAGSSGSGPIWLSLMRQILGNSDIQQFNQPSTVVSHAICRGNGALAQTEGDNTYTEYFLSGTLPTETCNASQKQETNEDTTDTQPQPADEDTTAPKAPTGLSATAGVDSVDLTWNAATDDVGVVSYKVYRDGQEIGTSTTTVFTDTGLTPLTTYSYKVVAVDAAGNISPKSTAASATTTDTSTGGVLSP